MNDLKVPGLDAAEDVFASTGDETPREAESGGGTARTPWRSGSAALGLLALGITAGMVALVLLVGMAAGSFGAVAAGCGGG